MLKKINLPWCANRYQVTEAGDIVERDEIKELKIINGKAFAEINWINGPGMYELGLLVLVAFGKLRLPDHLLGQVEVLYIDGNSRNHTPGNLFYKHKEPLEVDIAPGHYLIPSFERYAISRNGTLINVETGKFKSWATVKSKPGRTGGYSYTRAINNVNRSLILFRHRALCLTFKEYGSEIAGFVVNHKDGNTTNDSLDNLEWCSYTDNNRHAVSIGLSKQNKPVLMKDLRTGEVTRFASSGECARYLNNPRGDFIRYRIAMTPNKVFQDMLLFKYDDSEPWPEVNQEEIDRSCGSDIVARNVFTGDMFIFDSVPEAVRQLNIPNMTIHNHLWKGRVIPIKGYNFCYLGQEHLLPKHSERCLLIYKDTQMYPGNGVIFTDIISKEELFFTSMNKACVHFNLTTSAIRAAIKNNSILKEKYMVTIFKLAEQYSHPMERSIVK